MTAATLPRPVRVAIYTRKSVTDGLDQAFNSLDAQRQAIDAYVRSQVGLGWTALSKRYDDGGFSGATVDRPAFQALLHDVQAGLVDVVAVYKIDRLSRSLRDLAKLIDLFENHNVTFVSVTQHFSTANSMGRLTLNVLMSFAEYEREVIGERIRDKVQATRRRGMWTGGRPILGYDVIDKKLVINDDEAAQVRWIFSRYIESPSLSAVAAALNERGWRNKTYTGRRGQAVVGKTFSKKTVGQLLTNVIYRGMQRCKDGTVPGAHPPIIADELWFAVQERIAGNRQNGGAQARNKTGALLRGLIRCGRCGSPFLHTFTTKAGRRYRFYVCERAHNEGVATCPKARIAAGKFEQFVADQIRAIGSDEILLAKTAASVARIAADRRVEIQVELRQMAKQLVAPDLADSELRQLEHRDRALRGEIPTLGDGTVDVAKLRAAVGGFTPIWEHLFPAERQRILRLLIERVTFNPDTDEVDMDLRPCGIDALAEEATE